MKQIFTLYIMLSISTLASAQNVERLLVDTLNVEVTDTLNIEGIDISDDDNLPVDSVSLIRFEPLDSAYFQQLEDIMEQYEKEEKARQVLRGYEDRLLRREMNYNPDGWTSILRGVILTKTDKHYRDNAPLFQVNGNDWIEYGIAALPAAGTYISKLLGVKSTSTTKRMILSNAMAYGLTAGLCSGLKGVVSERRPDGSDDHSMPSRHVAMAFAAATILHREYGYKSPWISIGGYATATATQFLRLHNNNHWINDLYIGSGIGIVSTHFAYFITDKILGLSGISHKPKVDMSDVKYALDFDRQPTSLSLVSSIESGRVEGWTAEATLSTSLEYSKFFNPYFAVEAIGRISTTKINELNDDLLMYHTDIAVKGSYPIFPGVRFSARGIAGGRMTGGVKEIDDKSFEIGCGCSLDYMKYDKYAFGFSFDYYHSMSSLMQNRYLVGMSWKILL